MVDAGSDHCGRSVVCYGVAAVFTDPRYRKKGYAKHMMRLLHWVLAPFDALPSFPTELWGERPKKEDWIGVEQYIEGHGGNAAFSALYSVIGSELYKKCGMLPEEDGWVVQDPGTNRWNTDFMEPSDGEDWEWLDLKGVNKIWKVDRELMKKEMEQPNPMKAICAFFPDKGVAEFQILKLAYFWNKLDIKHWGVRKGNAFASWTVDLQPDSSFVVVITRLRAEKNEFQDLLRVMIGFAKRHEIKHFEIWGLKEELREQFVKAEKCGSLPAIKSYSTEYEWRFNEK